MKRIKRNNKTSSITMRLTKDERAKLELMAKCNEISIGGVMRILISKYKPCEIVG